MAAYNFAPYQRATYCSGRARPGTVALAAFVHEQFPKIKLINIYSCRDIYGGSGYSHHAEGRADDDGVPTTSGGLAIPSIGMPVIELLGPHGRALGIDHMIYNRRIWAAAYPGGKYYTGKHPHRDHWHIGMIRALADSLTIEEIRFIVLGVPAEPVPPPTTIGDVMLPFKKGDRSEDIRLFKDRMNETFEGTTGLGGVAYKKLDIADPQWGDVFEDATQNRVRDFLGEGFTGHPDGKKGIWVGGQQWNALELLWLRRRL